MERVRYVEEFKRSGTAAWIKCAVPDLILSGKFFRNSFAFSIGNIRIRLLDYGGKDDRVIQAAVQEDRYRKRSGNEGNQCDILFLREKEQNERTG